MTHEPLDSVLAKSCSGDPAAAERVFLAFEPYPRMVSRKKRTPQLRPKCDSMGVVQSIWTDLLPGFREAGWRFVEECHLRAFFVKRTRHRFIDQIRRHRTAVARERRLVGLGATDEPQSQQPGPSELAQATELRERMVALCPPAHREIIRLRMRGVPATEIAIRVGLHAESVRRILQDLACRAALERNTIASSSWEPK